MAKVSQPRGKSFEDAKLRFEDVEKAMKQKSGTVVINGAGHMIKALAGVCLETTEALSMPTALNLYLTAAGQLTSAPPHTDKQDVFVLQTQGRKRWRVFAPPPPSAKPDADPLARGKGKDALLLSELGPPLIDAILSPGHLLYVPAGWPHTTDTMFDAYASTSGDVDAAAPPPPPPSVHLTVGVESHIFALDYASLRALALRRLGGGGGGKFGGPTWLQKDLMRLTVLEEKAYWGMLEALPVGFLGENAMAGHRRWSDMREAVGKAAAAALLDKMRETEPTLAASAAASKDGTAGDAAAVPSSLSPPALDAAAAQAVAERLVEHHAAVTGLVKKMYGDVHYCLSDVHRDLSFFRAKPHLDALETVMEELVQWADASDAPANAAAPTQAIASGGGTGGAKSAGKGMGRGMGKAAEIGAGGGASKAGKGGKKKKS